MKSREPVLVGRGPELAALDRCLSAAQRREGRVVLINGEPGIGKSRLMKAFAARARTDGWAVLSGRAYDMEGMPPYLPFIEALRAHVRASTPDELRGQLGRGAPEVALLVPELLASVPGIAAGPSVSQDERYRLFEAVASFLIQIAEGQEPGLLLTLEDLHWADESTLRLLEHLARRLPEANMLVVAACRSAESDRSPTFSAVISNLQRERLCQQLDLVPLSTSDAAALVDSLAGVSCSQTLVEAIVNDSGGNPFFIEELVRNLQAEGKDLTDESPSARLNIPQSVRQVIGVRLARLRPDCTRLLQTASALGDPFSFEALAAALEGDFADLMDTLDEATRHGFIRDRGSDGCGFSHALVRETVYGGLSTPRRALLHAQMAQRLETYYGVSAAAHAGELANHFLLGGRREDSEKAMGYALQAAESAMEQFAFDDAVHYYRAALDAYGKLQHPDESLRFELSLALARATFKSGDMGGCDDIIHSVAEGARSAGLTDILVRACLARAQWVNASTPGAIPLLEHALAAIPHTDSIERSGLLSLLACQQSMAGSWEDWARPRDESVAMARRLGDPQALAFALRNAYIEWGPGRLEERREAVWEVVQLARELDDKELEVSSTCDHLQTSLLLGEPAAFDAGIESHVRLGEELQQRMQIAHGLILQSMRALLRGPISVAVHFNDELRRFVHRNSVPWAVPALDVHTLVLRWEQGRLAEFEASPFDELEPRSNLAGTCQLAFLHAELGRLDAARAVIRRLEPSRLRVTTQYLDRAFELSLLSQACSVVGALPQAEALYEAGLPFAGYMAKHTGAGACLGSVSRYLGLLATSLRRFEAAEHHFGEADEMNARFDAQPLLAHTKVDRARMHLARHGQGDRRQARALLEDAREMFERLGLGYHAGRAAELLAQPALDSARNRSRYPDGLTPREADILRLVAAGFSSREVGESLVLSVRTVERHIANAYLKTGTHNRAQLTAYVLSHGLTPLAT